MKTEREKTELSFTEFERLWQDCDSKLLELVSAQKNEVKRSSFSRLRGGYERPVADKLFLFCFYLVVTVFLGFKVELFLEEARYFVPYVVFMSVFVLNILSGADWLLRLWAVNPSKAKVLSAIEKIEAMKLKEKREMQTAIILALPLLIAACIIAIAAGVICYRKNKHIIEEIKNNLQEYRNFDQEA